VDCFGSFAPWEESRSLNSRHCEDCERSEAGRSNPPTNAMLAGGLLHPA
jgi:hypothetical protein